MVKRVWGAHAKEVYSEKKISGKIPKEQVRKLRFQPLWLTTTSTTKDVLQRPLLNPKSWSPNSCCWEGLGAGGEGDDRGWDGWMASLTRWTWVWVNSRSWWWTGKPGVLQFMGSQRVGHDWATELNWTELVLTHSEKSKWWRHSNVPYCEGQGRIQQQWLEDELWALATEIGVWESRAVTASFYESALVILKRSLSSRYGDVVSTAGSLVGSGRV